MIQYKVIKLDDCLVISAKEDNTVWCVEATFEKHEKDYAEMFCNILNDETKKAQENMEWKMSESYYKETGKFFNYHNR